MDRAGQLVLRYAQGENFNGSMHDIAGVSNEQGQRVRADAPPRARGRRADRRLDGWSEDLRVDAPDGGGRTCLTARCSPPVAGRAGSGPDAAEYELVCEKQGGPPNQVELAMYSLLWSEHCAYKHSKKLLRTLPTEGSYVVMGPGENAGAVDVGGGMVCAFKVESHNHPSAVEPFQGAATGVGGILRDIFAIGARPIAVLDSLRFGEPSASSLPLSARRSGERHRPLRQLDRRADDRRGGVLRGTVRAELPGQRDGAGARRAGEAGAQRGGGARQRAGPVRRAYRPRRDRGRLGARLGRAGRVGRRTSARPCRSAIRSRRRSCWSARWSCWSRD